MTTTKPTTSELVALVVQARLMPQHGLVAAGPTLPVAVMTAVLLDRACRTQLTAMAAGPLARWGSEEDTAVKRAEVWSAAQMQAGWDYLLRTAARPYAAAPESFSPQGSLPT